ncbi:hypothetical protein [Bacillus xiapuensis]|uniref:hypothetical protein n=1 Tax=Bacillus xiapuensis TaxID=2014075 RepID=UPI001E36212C|nr:hypothetical protein [Bacillus xiapuensis]
MDNDYPYSQESPEKPFDDERQIPFMPQGLPIGFPGGWPSPTQQPGSAPQAGGPPLAAPPSYPPQTSQAGGFAVDPGAIRGCLYRYTYVWLDNGRSFWFYPTYLGRTSIAGWRWMNFRWVYYGTDLWRIRSFQCYS